MTNALRVLDVSQLEPPEPLQRALAALDILATGDCLCLLHRREPLLLFPTLEQRGFDHITQTMPRADNGLPVFHIYIWRRHDAQAESVARRALNQLS